METKSDKLKLLVNRAEEFERAGELEKSLEHYSGALDILVKRAKAYAEKGTPGVIEAVVGTGIISEQYLTKFNEYLKKDKTAAVISNNMAALFAQMGDKASAKAFFEQAIDLTPKGACYDGPHIGLEMLKNQ